MKIRKDRWTESEDQLLHEYVVKGLTNKEISKLFPNRTYSAIKTRRILKKIPGVYKGSLNLEPVFVAQIVKFRKLGWAFEDICRVLKISCPTKLQETLKLAGFPWKTGRRYTIRGYRLSAKWGDWELHRLCKACRQKKSPAELLVLFPDRTWQAIVKKVSQITEYWPDDAEKAKRASLRPGLGRSRPTDGKG